MEKNLESQLKLEPDVESKPQPQLQPKPKAKLKIIANDKYNEKDVEKTKI